MNEWYEYVFKHNKKTHKMNKKTHKKSKKTVALGVFVISPRGL